MIQKPSHNLKFEFKFDVLEGKGESKQYVE
jgi:hypothetical protein